MERRRECIEALKQLAGSDDSNHDEVVRMRVKDCIEPEASDLRKQLQRLSEVTEMVDAPKPKAD
jgi:hypothetical protein